MALRAAVRPAVNSRTRFGMARATADFSETKRGSCRSSILPATTATPSGSSAAMCSVSVRSGEGMAFQYKGTGIP